MLFMGNLTCPHEDCKNETFNTERAMKIHYGTVHDSSLAEQTTECSTEGCNNKFKYYPSEKSGDLCKSCVEENNYHLTADKVEHHKVQCENCPNEKVVTEAEFNNHDIYFCEQDCRDEYFRNKIDIICDNCSEEKSVQAWRVKRSKENIYCNRKCWIESMKEGEFDNGWYGSSFEDVRSKVRERDDYECQICGKHKEELGENPSAHHITPVRWFYQHDSFSVDDANYIENMVLLCRKHHYVVEQDMIDVKEEIEDELVDKLDFSKPKIDSSS